MNRLNFVCMIFLIQPLSIQSAAEKMHEVLKMFDGGFFSTLRNVNEVQKYGQTQLESAIIHNDVMKVESLIFQHADVNLQNSKGRASLHQVVEHTCSPCLIQYLIDHGAKTTVRDNLGMTPLQLAQKMSNQSAIELLTKARTKSSIKK